MLENVPYQADAATESRCFFAYALFEFRADAPHRKAGGLAWYRFSTSAHPCVKTGNRNLTKE
jgi:hypothetical protein